MTIVPSVLIETPVNPPSSLIAIVESSIFALVAAAPSAKSVPLSLSPNTLAVEPPKTESIGVALKLSSNAVIVYKITVSVALFCSSTHKLFECVITKLYTLPSKPVTSDIFKVDVLKLLYTPPSIIPSISVPFLCH